MRHLSVLLALAFTLVGCASTPSRPPAQPSPDRTTEFIATCRALYVELLQRDPVAPLPGDPAGLASCVTMAKSGKTADDIRVVLVASDEYKKLQEKPPAPVFVTRKGIVRADNHLLRDDDGPHLFIGATLFWSVWGYDNDRDRLIAHYDWLKMRGVDYVRILGHVGSADDAFWRDRRVDGTAPGYEQSLAGSIDLAYAHGLRTQVTVFGGVEGLDKAKRRAIVDTVVRVVAARPEKVFAVEVVNEGYQNGFGNTEGVAEAREFARVLQSKTSVLVAVTAPNGDSCDKQREYYGNGVGTLVTLHFSRTWNGDGGEWRPMRQPWRESTFSCDGGVAPTYSNNEGIGPASSVQADNDPLRLAAFAGVSYNGAIGTFVIHTGSGIRGLADPGRNRPANIWDHAGINEVFAAIATTRDALPATVPNWSRAASRPTMFKVATFSGPSSEGTVGRIYCAFTGGEYSCTAIDIFKPTTLTAVRAMTLRVIHPVTGQVLHDETLAKDASFTLSPVPAAVHLQGRFQ